MPTIIDLDREISDLRAELQGCVLTRKERRDSEHRLEQALAEVRRRSEEGEA